MRVRRNNRGLRRHYLYMTWYHMRSRCNDPTHVDFQRYGARGITVDPAWMEFPTFCAGITREIGRRPEGFELDRIDNDGPYAPGNVRWADGTTQANNRRTNCKLSHAGRTMTLAQWSKETGVGRRTISMRIKAYGWTVEEALSTPSRKYSLATSIKAQPNKSNGKF